MKHLVLGSAGQIGSYVVDELKRLEHEVIEWDIVNDLSQDLSNRDNYKALLFTMHQCDFVHFLAFDVGGSTYLARYQDTYDFIENNMAIMYNVFEALRTTGVPFYFASSQMSNMGHSTYGRLKAVGESYTKSLENGVVVHFWNVFGIERDPTKTHVITDFIRTAHTERRILARTDGTEERIFSPAVSAASVLCGLTEPEVFSKYLKLYHENGPLPICPNANKTTISNLALKIAGLVGIDVEVYLSPKKDKVQGVLNKPNGVLLNVMKSFHQGDWIKYKHDFDSQLAELVEYERNALE